MLPNSARVPRCDRSRRVRRGARLPRGCVQRARLEVSPRVLRSAWITSLHVQGVRQGRLRGVSGFADHRKQSCCRSGTTSPGAWRRQDDPRRPFNGCVPRAVLPRTISPACGRTGHSSLRGGRSIEAGRRQAAVGRERKLPPTHCSTGRILEAEKKRAGVDHPPLSDKQKIDEWRIRYASANLLRQQMARASRRDGLLQSQLAPPDASKSMPKAYDFCEHPAIAIMPDQRDCWRSRYRWDMGARVIRAQIGGVPQVELTVIKNAGHAFVDPPDPFRRSAGGGVTGAPEPQHQQSRRAGGGGGSAEAAQRSVAVAKDLDRPNLRVFPERPQRVREHHHAAGEDRPLDADEARHRPRDE